MNVKFLFLLLISQISNEKSDLDFGLLGGKKSLSCSNDLGKNTKTITGLALVIAMKLEKTNNVTKAKIYEEFSSGTTIDSAYKIINDYFHQIIPEKYKDQIDKLVLKD